MKKWIYEVLLAICVSYTIISIIGGGINAVASKEYSFYFNLVMMLIWTSVAAIVLYSHAFFPKWPPLVVILIQYVIALSIILGIVWTSGFFEILSKTAYRDAFYSFTVPYIIFGTIFYIETFKQAKRADSILQELRKDNANNPKT